MRITLSFLCLNLIFFTTTHWPLSSASDIIYDSAGNKLLRGVPYNILPLLRGSGGGLTLSQSSKHACPLDITQEPFELSYGVPFTVTPIVLDQDYVRAAYPVYIEADVSDPCRGSKILQLSTTENVTAGTKPDVAQIVTIGGELNTPESCFQLVEDDVMAGLRSYQIQLCPYKCSLKSSTSLTCYNIGVVANDSGKRFLSLTDEIFPVVFANSFSRAIQSQKR